MPHKLLSLCCFAFGLLFAAACSSPPATPPVEGGEDGVPEAVSYEIDGETVTVRSEIDGLRIVETSPEMRTAAPEMKTASPEMRTALPEMRTVYSLDKGESRPFPIGSRIEVYGHLLTFDCMPDPSKCPTPKPIPTATLQSEEELAGCMCFGKPNESVCTNPLLLANNDCVRKCCGQ